MRLIRTHIYFEKPCLIVNKQKEVSKLLNPLNLAFFSITFLLFKCFCTFSAMNSSKTD